MLYSSGSVFQAAGHICLLYPFFLLRASPPAAQPLGDSSHPYCNNCPLPPGVEIRRPFPQFSLVSSLVPYDICLPDHSVLTLQLPVTASVREVMAALAQEDGWTKEQVLVKVNSAGGELCPWIDPKGGWPLRSAPRSPSQDHCHHCHLSRLPQCE